MGEHGSSIRWQNVCGLWYVDSAVLETVWGKGSLLECHWSEKPEGSDGTSHVGYIVLFLQISQVFFFTTKVHMYYRQFVNKSKPK